MMRPERAPERALSLALSGLVAFAEEHQGLHPWLLSGAPSVLFASLHFLEGYSI
jgi:hypothetical protein